MIRRICNGSTLAALIISMFYTNYAVAIIDSVNEVSSSAIATSVVYIEGAGRGCSGVLIDPAWVLAVAHCADSWSDRTIPRTRDAAIRTPGATATFENGVTSIRVSLDRVVRVDGAATLTNSIVLFHLASPAPSWSQPVPLYRGELPGRDEVIEVFGYGSGDRRGGTINMNRMEWNDTDKFFALHMDANPTGTQSGDSGGPLLITKRDRKYVIGVNWQVGAWGVRAASTFDIDSGGHWNPVGSLIERIIFPAATVRDGIYDVRAVHSDKCLDVPRSSRDDGTKIIQFNCTNATNQQWRFTRRSGYYEIRAVHSGKCLDVPTSSLENRVELIQYRCLNTTNQRWRLTEVADGAYEIQAEHSAKCVDVPRSSVANGVETIQFKCTRARNQRWKLTYERE